VVLSISINITGNVIMSPTLYSHIDQHSPYLKSSLPASVFCFFIFPMLLFFFFLTRSQTRAWVQTWVQVQRDYNCQLFLIVPLRTTAEI